MYSEKQRDIDNIQNLFFSRVNITEPCFPGAVHDIYIIETTKEKLIFRFSTKERALQNAQTSKILLRYNIPVPNVAVYKIGTKYCEVYPFIEGQTLYEKYSSGLSEEQTNKVYKQLYDICYSMSVIPTKEFKHLNTTLTKTDLFFQIMNLSPMVVGHSDLHDKNILLDRNNNVCAILDLDAVSIRPFSLLLLKLFENVQKYGYDIESIKLFNEKVYNNHKLLNLTEQAKLCNKLRNLVNKFGSHTLQKRIK